MFQWFGRVSFAPHTKVAAFAQHLREGRLMASRCEACGHVSFPPRADCEVCLHGAFAFVEVNGRGTLHTWTRIAAAPRGFEHLAPYTLGLVDLEDGGRALAWIGTSVPEASLAIGMPLRVVPRVLEDVEEIRVVYTLEAPPAGGHDEGGART
ncbi:MAG: Zn-ribbon domain-containing OB-fold protein [Candidatus Eisenbacteria bacterium]